MSQVPEIRIPSRYMAPLRAFRDLSEESAKNLFSALDLDLRIATRSQLLASLESKVREIGSEDAPGLLDALLSLHALRMSHSYSIEALAKAVSNADDLKEAEVDSDRFARRLVEALSMRSLALTAKALDVATADERLYHSCRIITDMRPVFGEDPTEQPVSALVVHTLQLTYFKDNELQNLHIALDNKDIANLKEVIDRALSKAASVQTFLVRVGLPPTDSEGKDHGGLEGEA